MYSRLLLFSLLFAAACRKDGGSGLNQANLPKEAYQYANDTFHYTGKTVFTYDGDGRVIRSDSYAADSSAIAREETTFNADGLPAEVRRFNPQPDGSFREVELTKNYYQLNVRRENVLQKVELYIGGALTTWQTFQLVSSTQTTQRFFYQSGATISETGKYELVYDGDGRLQTEKRFAARQTIPNRTIQYIWQGDKLVREDITTTLYPETTFYVYDAAGRLVSMKQYENGNYLLASITNEYDGAGRLMMRTSFKLQTSSYTHVTITKYKY